MDTPPTHNSERPRAAMESCLPATGDVLVMVDSSSDAGIVVGSSLAARTGGSVTAYGSGEFTRRSVISDSHHPRWAVVGNDPGRELSALSAWHDLVVAQRPAGTLAGHVAGFEQLLTCTGLPCLILAALCAPSGVFERVVLAWDGSRPATRALRAALPLVAAAREVVVLDGRGPHVAPVEPSFNPLAFLARHGIEAAHHRHHTLSHDAGESILARAHHFKADLLVMGAFGHSPLRERVFGGTTRHVLVHGHVATLLYH